MAKKIEEKLVDDIDGTDGASTHTFGFEGRFYEIDLSDENAKELKELLKPYIKAGRPTAPPKPTEEAKKIREWAKANDIEVSERGRIHKDVIAAYRDAKKR